MEVAKKAPAATTEYFDLYRRYINERHADGDMHPADLRQYESSFLVNGRQEAAFYEFRVRGKLLAIAVADELDNALSAIYTFFDPDASERSPGVYAVLWLIQETARLGRDHLYLGYWIKECQKMSYKMDYKPIEVLFKDHWTTIVQ